MSKSPLLCSHCKEGACRAQQLFQTIGNDPIKLVRDYPTLLDGCQHPDVKETVNKVFSGEEISTPLTNGLARIVLGIISALKKITTSARRKCSSALWLQVLGFS